MSRCVLGGKSTFTKIWGQGAFFGSPFITINLSLVSSSSCHFPPPNCTPKPSPRGLSYFAYNSSSLRYSVFGQFAHLTVYIAQQTWNSLIRPEFKLKLIAISVTRLKKAMPPVALLHNWDFYRTPPAFLK